MTDSDKILLTAYLDNELDENESLYIEELIKNDLEALEYLNNLKHANQELEMFFNSSDKDQLSNKINAFIENYDKKNSNPFSFFNVFHASFNRVAGIAAAVIFSVLLIPTFFSNTDEEIYQFPPLPIERSSTNITQDDILDAIQNTVFQMVDQDILKAELPVADLIILLEILETSEGCTSGTAQLINTTNEIEFNFCKDQ